MKTGMPHRTVLVVTLMIGVALAGCAGGSGEPQTTGSPTPTATETTGSVSGLIQTDELAPVEGAEVALTQATESTRTDEGGRFVFNNLTAGTYQLVAQKLGFESTARNVQVTAGEVTEVTLTFTPVSVAPDPFIDVLIFDGFIQCSVNPFLPMNLCGQALGEDTDRFFFEVDPAIPFGEIVAELVWEPTTVATAQHMEFDLCDQTPEDSNQVLCESDEHYWQYQSGPSPVVIREDDLPVEDAIHYEVNAGAGLPDQDDPLSVTPLFQQEFVIYVSLCYVDSCGEGYSGIPA